MTMDVRAFASGMLLARAQGVPDAGAKTGLVMGSFGFSPAGLLAATAMIRTAQDNAPVPPPPNNENPGANAPPAKEPAPAADDAAARAEAVKVLGKEIGDAVGAQVGKQIAEQTKAMTTAMEKHAHHQNEQMRHMHEHLINAGQQAERQTLAIEALAKQLGATSTGATASKAKSAS